MTVIRAGGGVSWFFTPVLVNIPNTSYLDIEASCTNNPFQLEIYGSSDRYYIYKIYFICTDTGYFIIHKQYVCTVVLELKKQTSIISVKVHVFLHSIGRERITRSHKIQPINNKIS